MSSESDITILNGVYPTEKPCPERHVGNGLENNSSALGCIRNATSDTVAGVLSYFICLSKKYRWRKILGLF